MRGSKSSSEMNNIVAHFLNIPVVDLFSKKFPYQPFIFPEEKIDKITSEISGVQLPNIILGKQAEFLFELLLKNSKTIELLAANIQINAKKQTIGELDYLIKNKLSNQIIHIELACKFYLFDESSSTTFEEKWIGPNRKDTLFDKVVKFKKKQFPLLFNPFATPSLEAAKINTEKIFQQYYLTSSFYVPKRFDVQKLPTAYQQCIVGTWVYFEDLIFEDDCKYAMPSKREWLLPSSKIVEWFNPYEIKAKISEEIKNKRAPQVYKKQGAQISKFFVVWWNTQ
ncbi:hypothetical protein ULMS_23530 [Patiriisocius marinistellae]|uniref:DUF1853 family protein n=1 Tax=Patiriisocius marinistellae TaxID=2494560 RepID=A0A5J4G2K3_9FLAO|nr:DUF1853 family protein [Patiriisocius marinistellae]GEQ86845.1 hypothetical protein ULMS_23530 [Patiriisocius marinistellae]